MDGGFMRKRRIISSFPMFYFLRDEYIRESPMGKKVEYTILLDIEDAIGGPKPTGYTLLFNLKKMVKDGINA
jgi:hypothetical protein